MEQQKTEVAIKYDEGKPDFTLISIEFLTELALVRAFDRLAIHLDRP